MRETFENILKQLEPEIGKYKSITALQEEEYPRHGDDATYLGSKVWVELEDEWLMLCHRPNKYGEYFTGSGTSITRPDSVWDLEDLDFELEKLLTEQDVTIEELANEIYEETHMFIDRTIDLTNVTEEDVMYMINCTQQVLELRSIQETSRKGSENENIT